jgi:hypothetical protein
VNDVSKRTPGKTQQCHGKENSSRDIARKQRKESAHGVSSTKIKLSRFSYNRFQLLENQTATTG